MQKRAEKEKILYVITKSNWGGAQRYVYDLVSLLPREEYEPIVAFGGIGEPDSKIGRLGKLLHESGVRTMFIKNFARDIYIIEDILAFFELISLYKEEKPDVVHLNSSKAGGLGALAARISRVPKIIFTSHGLAYDEDRNLLIRGLIFVTTWLTFLLCDEVIVISKDTFMRARKLPLCRKRIRLIYNGIPTIEFEARENARVHLKLPRDAFIIGTMGELTHNKGHQYLLQAAEILKKRGKNFLICIIGDGETRKELEYSIVEEAVEDRVILAGFVPDGARYLNAFDIFVLTSVKEGLPYVLMEAGAGRLPVVASNISGNIDIVGEDGRYGLLYESKDPTDLAEKLCTMIENKARREKCGENLWMRITSEFSSVKMRDETTAVYRI